MGLRELPDADHGIGEEGQIPKEEEEEDRRVSESRRLCQGLVGSPFFERRRTHSFPFIKRTEEEKGKA